MGPGGTGTDGAGVQYGQRLGAPRWALLEVADGIEQASRTPLLTAMPLGEHHVRAVAGLVAYADPIGATCQLSGGAISHERVYQ